MVDLAAAVHAVARDPRRRPEVALAVRVVHATPGRIPLGAPIVLKTVLRRDEVERAREEVAERSTLRERLKLRYASFPASY